MSAKTEELEKKLEASRAERAAAEETQYELDLEARIELEAEFGTIAAVKVARFVPGHPTRAYLRTPRGSEYKRYMAQLRIASDKKSTKLAGDAVELLAKACWVHPKPNENGDKMSEAQEAMLDTFPGLLNTLAIAAAALAEGKEETGKD